MSPSKSFNTEAWEGHVPTRRLKCLVLTRLRWFLTKDGAEINASHDLHTQRNRSRELAGSLNSISVMISSSKSGATVFVSVFLLILIWNDMMGKKRGGGNSKMQGEMKMAGERRSTLYTYYMEGKVWAGCWLKWKWRHWLGRPALTKIKISGINHIEIRKLHALM